MYCAMQFMRGGEYSLVYGIGGNYDIDLFLAIKCLKEDQALLVSASLYL